MFLTTYHLPKFTGMNRFAIEQYGEVEARRFEDDFFKTSAALKHWNINRAYIEDHDSARQQLFMRIDGSVNKKPVSTLYLSSYCSAQREKINEAMALGYLLLHYQPKRENGLFSEEDGLQIPLDPHAQDSVRDAQREALWFAFGFLTPPPLMTRLVRENALNTLNLPKSFIDARLKFLKLEAPE